LKQAISGAILSQNTQGTEVTNHSKPFKISTIKKSPSKGLDERKSPSLLGSLLQTTSARFSSNFGLL
jgi:hypothetical protein